MRGVCLYLLNYYYINLAILCEDINNILRQNLFQLTGHQLADCGSHGTHILCAFQLLKSAIPASFATLVLLFPSLETVTVHLTGAVNVRVAPVTLPPRYRIKNTYPLSVHLNLNGYRSRRLVLKAGKYDSSIGCLCLTDHSPRLFFRQRRFQCARIHRRYVWLIC